LESQGANNDRRKESRRPVLDTIQIVGDPLPTLDDWRQRRLIIDRQPHHTLKQLEALYEADRTSLGVLRPTAIHDLVIEPDQREWKSSWKSVHDQLRLFPDMAVRELKKLPWKWSIVFSCADSPKPIKRMVEDWELGALHLKEVTRLGDERQAAESVRSHYLNTVLAPGRDVRFFMGTCFPYNTLLIIGIFWPPRVAQMDFGWD
jgi:hypothetical protein